MTKWKSRWKGILAGLVFIAFGWLRLRAGVQVVIHGYGQPMFSFGLIAGGAVMVVACLLPNRLIAKIATVRKGKHRRGHVYARK
jgi:hypothetical protein